MPGDDVEQGKRALSREYRDECSTLKASSSVAVKACHQAKVVVAVGVKGCECWTVRLTLRLTLVMVAALYMRPVRPSVWSVAAGGRRGAVRDSASESAADECGDGRGGQLLFHR